MASEHPPEDQKENRERPSDQYGYPYDFAYQRTNEERRRWSKYKEQIKQRRDKFVVFAELHDKAFLAIGTAFIAIFTIIVAVSTFALWWATSDLVTDAVNTAQRQLRAYIGPYEMELTLYAFPTNGPDKPYGFIAHAEMRNFGQTPAYDLMIYADAKFDAPNAAPFKFPSSSTGLPKAGIAFPQAGLHINKGWAITTAEYKAIEDRKEILFFWGTVWYNDAFHMPHHFTYRMVSVEKALQPPDTFKIGPHVLGYDAD